MQPELYGKVTASLVAGLALFMTGCGMPVVATSSETGGSAAVSSITPSGSGTPNYTTSLGKYSFVSVQGTGQVFTYNVASGSPVQVGAPYATPCRNPSGMVIANIAGRNVMAVACYDGDSLLTLTVNANGSLSPLGSVTGLPIPYPGLVLDGTDVYVPLHGIVQGTNGGVARVSIATPSAPVVTGTALLVSSAAGGFVNPGYMAQQEGFLIVAAGSEDQPHPTTSTLQVVAKSKMTPVGTPLPVDHSPQQIAVHNNTAFVTYYDAEELQSVDVTDPTNLQTLQTLSLASRDCAALPILVRENFAYVGCYGQNIVEKIAVDDPANMYVADTIPNVPYAQRMDISPMNYLMVTSAVRGGAFYEIEIGRF